MGLFRSRLSRRQSRRSQREHISANDSTSDETIAPGDELIVGTTTSKQVIRKVLVYLAVIGFLQLNQWKKKKKVATTNTTSAILSRLDDQVYIINNVLPLGVAIRWRNALHHEWSRAQNGEWQYCSSALVCNADNIRSRNETVHALQLEDNDTKEPFLQSKWVLGPDQHHMKTFLRELNTEEIKSRLVDILLQIVSSDDIQPPSVIRIVTSSNLVASHFTTGDFDNNIMPVDDKNTDDIATDRTSFILSFHITLLQPPTTLEDGESTLKSSSLHSWENNFGGILVPAKGFTNNLVENNDEFATKMSITPQFNSAVIWKRHDVSTSTTRRILSPISWLAEKKNARLYVVSGDFLIQTTTTTKASQSSLEDTNGSPTHEIGSNREPEKETEL